MIKKYFTKAVTFVRELVVSLWEATDQTEVPSKRDWKLLTDFESMAKHTPLEAVQGLGAVIGITLFTWIRNIYATTYLLAAFTVIHLLVIYKALTFWKKGGK
jgi:hypothetical protein